MSELLLGIDEGTSAVKAVLYDEDLRPVAEARREKPLSHPRSGWVEQDPEAVMVAVVDAVAELLHGADGEIVACGLDHQGESVLAWDAESGDPLTPIVTWQDKRSQEILDELEADGRAERVRERSRLPLDPYFSAGKLAWLLRNDERVAAAVAAGTARLGTVDAWLCDMLGAGFATDLSTASRTQLAVPGEPDWDAELLEVFGVPHAALPPLVDTAGELGELRHPDWPRALPLRARIVDQQAALAGAGCVEPGRVKATYGTGVFVLANVGEELPGGGAEGLFPTVAWRIGGKVEFALDGGVFTAGRAPQLAVGGPRPRARRGRPGRPRRSGRGLRRREDPARARRSRRPLVAPGGPCCRGGPVGGRSARAHRAGGARRRSHGG